MASEDRPTTAPAECTGPGHTSGHAAGRGTIWPLLLILLLSTVVDTVFFTGFYASDDVQYFSGARLILEHGSLGDEPALGQRRLALVLWNLLVAVVLGYKAQLIAASYILFHQLANVLTFLLARRLFDRTVGLVAAYITGLSPVLVVFSSQVMPDIPLACCVLLALLMFLRACDLRQQDRPAGAGLAMFIAGVAVGLGYLTKESGLLLLPFLFVCWLVCLVRRLGRPALWDGGALVLGFAVVFLAEYAALSYLTGRPFFRLGWTFGTSDISPWIVRKVEQNISPMARWQWMLNETHETLYPLTFKIAAAVSVPVCLLRRGRWRWTVAALALWLFGYLTWGSMNLSRYLPPTIQARYYIPVVPLAVIASAALAVGLVRGSGRVLRSPALGRSLSAVGLVLLTLVLGHGLRGPDALAGKAYGADLVTSTTQALAHARQLPERPIVISAALERRLRELKIAATVDVRRASTMKTADLTELVESGGFYYLEANRDSTCMRSIARMLRPDLCRTDAVLHAAAWHNVTNGSLSVRELRRFSSPASRLDTLRRRLLHSWTAAVVKAEQPAPNPLLADIRASAAQRHCMPHGGVVCLHEVARAARPAMELLTGFTSAALRITDATPRGDHFDAAAGMTNWSAAGSGHRELTFGRDSTAAISLALPASERIELTPAGDDARSTWTLRGGRMNLVCAWAELDDGVRAEWLLDNRRRPAGADSEAWQELRDGKPLSTTIDTRRAGRWLLPRLRLGGSGTCRPHTCILSAPVDSAAADALLCTSAGLSSVHAIPFRATFARDGETVEARGWRIPVHDERVTVSDTSRGRAQVSFDLPGNDFIRVSLRGRLVREKLGCQPHGTLLIGIEFSQTGRMSGYLAGVVYADPRFADEAVAQARLPVAEGGMAWFLVQADDAPLYLRPVLKLHGQGSISIERCIALVCEPRPLAP